MNDPSMPSSSPVVIETAKLRCGATLQYPLVDSKGLLLLNSGAEVTEAIKQHLLDRKIEEVTLSQEDSLAMFGAGPSASRVRGAGKRDRRPAEETHGLASLVRSAGMPLKGHLKTWGARPYDPLASQRLASRFATTTTLLGLTMQSVIHGDRTDGAVLAEAMEGYLLEMQQDLDHVVASSGILAEDKQLVQRSLRTAMLGMAVGIEMGLDATRVAEVGQCALVHDWGLCLMPERLRSLDTPLGHDEWGLFRRHPLLMRDALCRLENLSPVVKVAAWQVHEMCDGSGYPRGLTKNRIHLYARILGPVSAFLGLSESRRGRLAVIPYDAIACLVHQLPLGRFDREAVFALLGTLSLFPLGSQVRLADGQRAVVIRRSASDYSKPIVQCVGVDEPQDPADAPTPTTTIIDLSESSLTIVDALPTPGSTATRLDRALIYDVLWDGPGGSSLSGGAEATGK